MGIDILGHGLELLDDTLSVSQTYVDDIALKFGTGGTVSLIYETADANANALMFVAPEGGAVDVPVFIFGDASIDNVDLGFFNGVTEPTAAVINDAKDAYASLDAGDDAVAGSKGLYFKAAADEDIELINLSVTGTPRIYWDESADKFGFENGLVLDSGHIRIGTAPASEAGLNFNETVTLGSADYNGVGTRLLGGKTAAAFSNILLGLYAEVLVSPTNTQNFTNSTYGGVLGVYSAVQTDVNSTGTITLVTGYASIASAQGAAITSYKGYFAKAPTVISPGTIASVYQVYIETPTVGGTNNYSIYSEGGANYFGGSVKFGAKIELNAQVFDAGTGDAEIDTTGGGQGLLIKSTQDGTTGARLMLHAISASPAANDEAGAVLFRGNDNGGALTTWGGFYCYDTDPTNENSTFEWWLRSANAANQAMKLLGDGTLSVDLAGVGAAAQVDLFDDYDDALILRQGIQQKNRELLANIGVLTRKDGGSSYMMNLQPMVKLLAGGIYQSRTLIDRLADRLDEVERNLLVGGQNGRAIEES